MPHPHQAAESCQKGHFVHYQVWPKGSISTNTTFTFSMVFTSDHPYIKGILFTLNTLVVWSEIRRKKLWKSSMSSNTSPSPCSRMCTFWSSFGRSQFTIVKCGEILRGSGATENFSAFYNSKLAPAKAAPKSAHIHRGWEQGALPLGNVLLPAYLARSPTHLILEAS